MPGLSVILPANNEAAHIAACLDAVLASAPLRSGAPVQIIVVPNGCVDATARIAHSYVEPAQARGWSCEIIDLQEGSKLAALNAGDAATLAPVRVYLDADVVIEPDLLAQIAMALSGDRPGYASGTLDIAPPRSWITRLYKSFYLTVPFIRYGVPGCGLFAVNDAGRARWGAYPQIISDDTFVRLQFTKDERHCVPARYQWPLVEGWKNLVRVRRRQNIGVDEIGDRWPELLLNDEKPNYGRGALIKTILRHPLGFIAYASVALAVKVTPHQNTGWSRGR